MYFEKIYIKPGPTGSVTHSAYNYYFYTNCSRGKGWLTPDVSILPYDGRPLDRTIYLSERPATDLKTGDRRLHKFMSILRGWTWQAHVFTYRKPKENEPYPAHALTAKGFIKNTRYCRGSEKTLLQASKALLQRIFSYRRTSLSELMKMLVKDQFMYELSKLGS